MMCQQTPRPARLQELAADRLGSRPMRVIMLLITALLASLLAAVAICMIAGV